MKQELPSGTPVHVFGEDGSERGLIILTDIFGLRPVFVDMGERMAKRLGRKVAVVELWPGNESLGVEEKWALIPSTNEADRIRDLEDAADLLGVQSCGLIGFCMGGMYVLRAAGVSKRFDRIVSFYGMIRLPEGASSPIQSQPIDRLRDPSITPTLAIFGGNDSWCPADHIAELDTLGTVEIREYKEAGHAFAHDASHENFRADDAQDAWRNAVEFLDITQK